MKKSGKNFVGKSGFNLGNSSTSKFKSSTTTLVSKNSRSMFSTFSSKFRSRKASNTSNMNSSSVYISNQPQQKYGSCLLLVDPQNDFVADNGSLKVPGAIDDCKRIAKFIRDNVNVLQEIYVTLDSHMRFHIAHPSFWWQVIDQLKDSMDDMSNLKHPDPFTSITYQDVVNGKFKPVQSDLQDWVLYYTKTLEESTRLPGLSNFTLTIWPPHCLISTSGHNIFPELADAISEWEEENTKCAHFILKGNNSKTEHYSAFRAEVIVPEDENTDFNYNLYNDLEKHSKIFVAGEAKSHCVNFTVRDLVDKLGAERSKEKVVLLESGMSSVVGCENLGDKFWKDMKMAGLKHAKISMETKTKALGFGLNHVSRDDLPSL